MSEDAPSDSGVRRRVRARVVVGALSIVAALVGLAIWRSPERGLPAFAASDEATRAWLSAAPTAEEPPCGGQSETAEAGDDVPVSLFVGPDVPEVLVRRQLGGMRDVFAPYGIDFVLDAPPRSVRLREATAALLDEAAAAEEPPPGSDARRARWRALLAPGLVIVKNLGVPPRRAIHVVFVARIAPARSVLRRLVPHLGGLTLGETGDDPDIRAILGVPAVTTTIFISAEDVASTFTLAHEMGHALGLVHVAGDENLMSPRPHACRPFLSDAQLEAITPP